MSQQSWNQSKQSRNRSQQSGRNQSQQSGEPVQVQRVWGEPVPEPVFHKDDYMDEENVDDPVPGIVVESQFGMFSGSGRKSRSTSRSGQSQSPRRRRSISVQRVRETRTLNSQDTIKQSPNDRLPPPPPFEIPYWPEMTTKEEEYQLNCIRVTIIPTVLGEFKCWALPNSCTMWYSQCMGSDLLRFFFKLYIKKNYLQ